MDTQQFMRFMAAWALVHETADEGWKSAVERGRAQAEGEMAGGGPEAFVDGLSAMIAEETERLKAQIAAGGVEGGATKAEVAGRLDELAFEVGELRGRIETLQASIDALDAPRDAPGDPARNVAHDPVRDE